MPTSVLLSVKPEFVGAILDGTKRFEFRRSIFRCQEVQKVVLYASSPVQMVVGEFDVAEIITMELSALWRRTKQYAGIRRAYFDEYFVGLTNGHALAVERFRRYRCPLHLQHFGISRPPQSFLYLR